METSGGSSLSRMVRLLLFCMMQGAASSWSDLRHYFLSFEPVLAGGESVRNPCRTRRRALGLAAAENR